MIKHMVPWQAKRFNTRARRAGLEEVTVLNFHIEPTFAKKGHRTLLAVVSLLMLARANGCLLITGDANAAAYGSIAVREQIKKELQGQIQRTAPWKLHVGSSRMPTTKAPPFAIG